MILNTHTNMGTEIVWQYSVTRWAVIHMLIVQVTEILKTIRVYSEKFLFKIYPRTPIWDTALQYDCRGSIENIHHITQYPI